MWLLAPVLDNEDLETYTITQKYSNQHDKQGLLIYTYFI